MEDLINSESTYGLSAEALRQPRKKINKHWKNEPSISVFRADLNLARQTHDTQVYKINQWVQNLNAESDSEMLKQGRSGIQPKLIRKMAEWRYSAIASPFLNTKHLFIVDGASNADMNAAIQIEKMLNYQFSYLIDKVKFINDLVRVAVNEGTAIVRVGWLNDEREEIVEEPVYTYRKPNMAELREIEVRSKQWLKLFMDTNGAMVGPDLGTGQQPIGEMDSDGNPIMGQNPADSVDQLGAMDQGQGGMPPSMGMGAIPQDDDESQLPDDGLTQAIQQQYKNPSLKLPDGKGGYDGTGGRSTVINSIKKNLNLIRNINVENNTEFTDDDFKLAYMKTMEELSHNPNFYVNVLDSEILDASLEETFRRNSPVVAVKTDQVNTYTRIKTVANQPVVEVMDTADIYIDPTCNGDLDKAQFVVYKFETCLSDLRSQKAIYNNLDELEKLIKKHTQKQQKDDKNILDMSDEEFMAYAKKSPIVGNDFLDEPRSKLIAYEYWGYYDINDTGTTQPIVATIVENVIIRLEKSPYPDGKLPFVALSYLPVKGSIYGEPDGALLKDNQTIITALTRGFVDLQAKSSIGQIATPKGYTDSVNLMKLYSGQNYMYNPTINPNDAVYIHKGAEIPQTSIAFLEMQNNEAEALTGVKTFQKGLDQTAYSQNDGGNSMVGLPATVHREGDILQRFKKALEKIAHKVISMNAEFLNPIEVVRISRIKYESIKKEDLKGNVSVEVDIKSPLESQAKAQNLAFILQTLGPTVDFSVTRPILQQIAKLFGLDDLAYDLGTYQPQPDPLEQALKQAQIQKEQAQALEFQARAEKAKAESQKAYSEVIFNQARTEYVKAMANKLDQEFLDTVTGVEHARQQDNIKAQAKAQGVNKLAEGNNGASSDIVNNARSQILDDGSSHNVFNDPVPTNRGGDTNGNDIPNPVESSQRNNANGIPTSMPMGAGAKAPTGEPPGADGGSHALDNLFSKIGA